MVFDRKFRRSFKKISDILKITYKYHRQTKVAAKGHTHIPRDALYQISQSWAYDVVASAGFQVSVTGQPDIDTPHIFVGNHISYIDIAILMTKLPAVFVAKNELRKWPLFGPAAKVAGTMFVKRESKISRKKTCDSVGDAIMQRRQSVILFPSGTTCLDESKPWRWGAFEIAKNFRIPMQPFRLAYTPLRAAAFIDDDLFIPHMFELFSRDEFSIRLEFGQSFFVENIQEDCERVRLWTQEFLRGDLK